MTINFFQFILLALAVFRLTHLIVYDNITEFIRRIVIQYREVQNESGEQETIIVIAESGWKKWFGELLTCHWCMGIWMSLFLWVGYSNFPGFFDKVILIFAAAGVASIIHTIILRFMD